MSMVSPSQSYCPTGWLSSPRGSQPRRLAATITPVPAMTRTKMAAQVTARLTQRETPRRFNAPSIQRAKRIGTDVTTAAESRNKSPPLLAEKESSRNTTARPTADQESQGWDRTGRKTPCSAASLARRPQRK